MALDRHIARLAKILVDTEGISFPEAQARLRALTLEVVVGPDAVSPAAHAAVLTAVSVGHRTFVGGVRVSGAIDQPLTSALPLKGPSLGEAAGEVGVSAFDGSPSRTIIIGAEGVPDAAWSVEAWWDGWRAGADEPGKRTCGDGDNPLAGITAGAIAVGKAFEAERGRPTDLSVEIDLWPATCENGVAPRFGEIFLPGAIWLIGLGNLGQAFLWALAALPYAHPNDVSLVLQDRDKISEENWATSVLVTNETYGQLKTRVGEAWAMTKGFDVRRIDRHLVAADRLENDDPRIALSGVDRIEARKLMSQIGFDCIVDAGLGGTAHEFDHYRVNVFDRVRPIDKHFADQTDAPVQEAIPEDDAYQGLLKEVGGCGAAEIAGASVAAPYVSALAAAVAVSRLIAVCSGCECPTSEVGKVSAAKFRRSPAVTIEARGARHSGGPSPA